VSRQRSTITSHSPWMSTISTCPGCARMACTPARRRSSCRRGGVQGCVGWGNEPVRIRWTAWSSPACVQE
jgi:hypothetical protein